MKKSIIALCATIAVTGALASNDAVNNNHSLDTQIQATIINDSAMPATLTHVDASPWQQAPLKTLAPGQADQVNMKISQDGAGFILGYSFDKNPNDNAAFSIFHFKGQDKLVTYSPNTHTSFGPVDYNHPVEKVTIHIK